MQRDELDLAVAEFRNLETMISDLFRGSAFEDRSVEGVLKKVRFLNAQTLSNKTGHSVMISATSLILLRKRNEENRSQQKKGNFSGFGV